MADREYIIGGLESFLCKAKAKKSCEINGIMLSADDVESIVAMLKVQEPVAPHMVDWGIYECPICKTRVDKTYKFCKVCGTGMKWE